MTVYPSPPIRRVERRCLWRGVVLAAVLAVVGVSDALADTNSPAGTGSGTNRVSAVEAFGSGVEDYRQGNYAAAAKAFGMAARSQPGSGTLQNLGNAEWQRGSVGPAILAWEQSLWLDPFNKQARSNLVFARKTAQLESPNLSWYEVVSTWLPVNSWAWIAGLSLWLTVAMTMLPGILRIQKTSWQQAVAALGLAVFLLSLPAHAGVMTRARIGFVLPKNVPLRLTPTQEAQFLTTLATGDPVRLEREHGDFVLVRTSRSLGWLQKSELGLICPR